MESSLPGYCTPPLTVSVSVAPSMVDSAPHRHRMGVLGSAVAPVHPLEQAKTPRTPSPLELRLMVLIRPSGFEEPVAEYPFAKCPGQRWRFDFAWPAMIHAVHVDGGAWVPGGARHTRGAGFAADHDKMNRASLKGVACAALHHTASCRRICPGRPCRGAWESAEFEARPAPSIWLSVPMNRPPSQPWVALPGLPTAVEHVVAHLFRDQYERDLLVIWDRIAG